MNLLKELRERRVPHFVSAYVVGGFGLVEFLEFLEGRMELSPHFVNLVALTLLLILPSVILLAWSFGRPGRDRLGRLGKFAVPANLIAAAVLLLILFQGKELGAVTRTIEVEDEHGAVTERVVPKGEFRRRLLIFYPENGGPEGDGWASRTVGMMLGVDVSQDIFLDVVLPLNMADVLRDAGHEDGLGLPRALMRKIARDGHYPHFTTGSVRREGEVWHLDLELHESESGRVSSTRTYEGSDLFGLVDRATLQLREDLGIPGAHLDESQDLPVSELTSTDLEAVRSHVEGLTLVTHENDWAGAAAPLQDAVERDPHYAIAHFLLFGVYQTMGRSEESEVAMAAAMDNLYRVTERTSYLIKSEYYFNVERDIEKAMAVLKMWSRLYPNDLEAYNRQAMYHYIRQDLRAAVGCYESILEIDPSQYRYFEEIADLYHQLGEDDEAERYLKRYVNLFPSRADGYKDLSDFYSDTGRLADAREALEEARLLEPGDIDLALGLIDLDVKQGRYDASRAALDDELGRAVSARDRAKVHARLLALAQSRGRADDVIANLDAFYENMSEVQNPLQLDIIYAMMLPAVSRTGRPDEAISRLDAVAARIAPPFDALTGISRAGALAGLGRAAEARDELARATEVVDTYQFETFRAPLSLMAGRAAEADGDLDGAVAEYRGALASFIRYDPIYHLKLAGVLRRRGDLDEARTALEDAMSMYPAHPEAHLEMALIDFEEGRTDAARTHLETARAAWTGADPGYEPALEAARLAERLERLP